MPFGATPRGDGSAEFRVWAPRARRVEVRLGREGRTVELEEAGGEGVFTGEAAAAPGEDYRFVLDGSLELPDPCSRSQPGGVSGPSRLVDTASFPIRDGPRLRLDELVVYELHVGTFSASGTFDGVVPHLAALRDLGVTAVEVMPVATFPGSRGWGYDGLYVYAPHPCYGGPESFARLVDACHGAGLAVILDVVYNHLGPGSDALTAFGPYLTDRHTTPWGGAIDYSRPAVREWALGNAEMWVRDFKVDGLRLDAVFAIVDDGPVHVLRELRSRLPEALLVAEEEVGTLRPLEEWGFDGQWADEFHHELHVALTGERHGYYAGYGSLSALAAQYEREDGSRLVFCSQNHDQVGNRAVGDRPAPDELPVRAACLLLAPAIPLLFMGEEYGEQAPFQFFTDHVDPAIAEATRAGRRREFPQLAGEAVPDPQARSTFERSRLTRVEQPGVRALYRELLELRRRLPPGARAAAASNRLVVERGGVELVADLDRRVATILDGGRPLVSIDRERVEVAS